MKKSFDKFCQILADTENAQSIYDYFFNVVKPPYDFSDLLRWQWAQSVSALDKLIHDLIRCGMIEIYQGKRFPTPKYKSFAITLELFNEIKANPSHELQIIEKQIILSNGYKSYQDPDNISDGLSYIWNENNKWDKIAKTYGDNSHNIKTYLKNIVIRRNQIVHEGDYDGYSIQRQFVLESDVKDVISFISNIGKIIYNLVR